MEVELLRYPYLGIYVNSFRLHSASGDVLIDSGLASGRSALECSANHDSVLLSTHGHWDHIGNHGYLQKRGVCVYAHPGDLRYYSDHTWHWEALFGQFSEDFDLPAARRTTFVSEIGEEMTPECAIADGEVLSLGDLSIQVIATPGHSAGSVCYLVRETGDLFTGDSLMGEGFFGGLPQYADSLAYRDSMEKLTRLSVEKVYCDHNEPMPGSELRKKAEQGIACCERLEHRVREFVAGYRGPGERMLGEAVAAVCRAEGKKPGGGICVTVLTHLREMGEADEIRLALEKHIPV